MFYDLRNEADVEYEYEDEDERQIKRSSFPS